MTEERFIYFKNPIGFGKQGIEDKQTNEVFDFTLDNVLDVMNNISDENEQLYELIDFANTLIAFKGSKFCQAEWKKRLEELRE